MSTLAELVQSTVAPLEEVALLIALDEAPALQRDAVRNSLDRLGRAAAKGQPPAGDSPGRLDHLCRAVYQRLGFRCDEDYDDPRGNLLDQVLERRLGSPVLLAVVLIAVGRRVGVTLEPISYPGHFLARAPTEPPTYIDPAGGGHPLDPGRLLELARESLGTSAEEAAQRLEPVGARTVVVRILQNLLRIHRLRADHARALVVCDRLYEMTQAPCHRADRGAHALALGAACMAADDLQAYLEAHPNAADADVVRAVLAKLRQAELDPPS